MATGHCKVFVIAIGSAGTNHFAELQEFFSCLKKAEISPGQYDDGLLADLIQRFAQMIELPLPCPEPVPDLNVNSSSAGSYARYILPAVALATLGLGCTYKLLKVQGWSFARVMYVTSHSFNNAVETLSKQIDSLHASVASVKRLVSEKLGGLDLKVGQVKEFSQKTWDYLVDAKPNILNIGNNVENIAEAVAKLTVKVELLETKQDLTNKGISYLCDHVKDERNAKFSEGLQSIAERSVPANNSGIKKTGILGLYGILERGHNTGRLLGN